MKKFIVVEDATGHIYAHGTAGASSNMDCPVGHTVYEDVWGAESGVHYWDGSQPQLMQKLEDIITLDRTTVDIGLDENAIFTGIPSGTTVERYESAAGTPVVIEDGILVYDTDIEGEHHFIFHHPRYIDWAVSVVAV